MAESDNKAMEIERKVFKFTPKVSAENVENKFGDVINFVLMGTAAATAGNYSVFHNVTNPMELIRIEVSYTAASTSGTLQLEKLTGTQAPGAGSAIISTLTSTVFDLADALKINTVLTREQRAMTTSRTFKQGDRIAFIDGGNLANLTDLVVSIYYKPLGRGGYR